ncbi:hypothetical protein MUN88_14285 [Gracilibacillus caseinilyticus]|uniref:Haemolysin XhlA n=1 Tax=Gracilibacillus caseinilyticus TaxID=2932256 RepID=A0ABY4ESA4_9BACI|nr:hypothetical protein [Gracilibacillus caseinilyticus]UOQ47235.1 hypothetical protein MUN88_14285 [Gracilibacillus caseinilyticus]
MTELTKEDWNNLVNNVGNVADKTQQQLLDLNAYVTELNNTLTVTNIILGIIAITYILSTIIKFMKK